MLDRRSQVLRLIQQIRDESHRFAVTFHRKRRDRQRRTTQLEDIAGIGPRTARKLLDHFGSMKKVSETSPEELSKVVNRRQVESLRRHFDQT